MIWKTLDIPRDNDIHTYADFYEILCLTSLDREVSIEDLADHINDFSETNKVSNNRKSDILRQIEWRSRAFSERYPFVLNEQVISMKGSQFPYIQTCYFLLLFSSNLPFVNKGYHKILTDSFERFSLYCLKEIWFSDKFVRPFGKNESEFFGKKHERLNQLFSLLGHIGEANENDFRNRDSGDGGIDIAAWFELDSYEKGNIISTVIQCACSRADIKEKQREVVFENFSSYVRLKAPWIPALFTPVSLRDNVGKWNVPADIASIVILDRLRLLNCLPTSVNKESIEIFMPDIFEEMINYTRSITD